LFGALRRIARAQALAATAANGFENTFSTLHEVRHALWAGRAVTAMGSRRRPVTKRD
jgi:hypothetical protein